MSCPKVTAKIARDWTISLPKEVCDDLGLQPGDEIRFGEGFGGWYIRKETPRPSIEEIKAALDYYKGYLKDDLDGQDVDEFIEEIRGR